jgi:hypothetical protein
VEKSIKKENTMKMYGRHPHEDDEDFFGSNLGAGIEAMDGAKEDATEEENEDGFPMDEEEDGIVMSDTDGFILHDKDDMGTVGVAGDED